MLSSDAMKLPVPSRDFPLLTLLCAVFALGLSAACHSKSQPDSAQNAAESEAYKSLIEISKIGLAKGENYLGGHVYYVEGTLRNAGQRLLQRVDLVFVFRDSLNQIVLKESRKALDYKGGGGLEANKSTRFQVAFDHLPQDWNHIIPEVDVAQVTIKQ